MEVLIETAKAYLDVNHEAMERHEIDRIADAIKECGGEWDEEAAFDGFGIN